MTIQIAQRIGRALNVTSATKIKELDEALRAYVRAVPPGATLPVSGSIDASQVVSGTFADARIGVTNVTQHQAALSITNAQLPGYTAADVLAKLLTVDGAASGLDADLLDGQSSAAFAPAPTVGTWTPVDSSGAGLALAVTDARYWKLDKLVIAKARLQYPVTADVTNALIGGLPFALDANESSRQGYVSFATTGTLLYCLPIGSSSTLQFRTAAGGNVRNVDLTGVTMLFQVTYITP